jgi:polysaccharide export outer membrane protein
LKIHLILCGLLVLAGCAASNSATPAPQTPEPLAVPPTPADTSDPAELRVSRLDQLWQSRRTGTGDFPIGPGDVISVYVAGLDLGHSSIVENTAMSTGSQTIDQTMVDQGMDSTTAKVNSQGFVELPLIGQVHAAGMTEDQLRLALKQRLQKYMYDPDVQLSVRSYNSRQVSVTGEVRTPGMYTIVRPNETIRDVIMQAGGTTENAGSRVILTPAPAKLSDLIRANDSRPLPSQNDSSYAGVSDMNPLSVPGVSGATLNATYVIDLSKGQTNQRYLNIPLRPGDTVFIPQSGTVTIVGWVYTPKTLIITPGLTVLNAISQAGGTLFAADTKNIKILREGAGHETSTVMVNLNQIKEAKAPDILVQANDVIDVSYNAAKIPGYALYYAAQGVLNWAPAALMVNGL